jgi:small subunit ribosomal protein S4
MRASNLPQRRPSDYALQLREKQQLRNIYGMLEKPFQRYVRRAERMSGVAGEMLLQLLERRLDNVIYRAGFASGRQQARQWVAHRHVSVNGRTVDVPSFQVRVGDVVQIRESLRAAPDLKTSMEAGVATPSWLAVAPEEFKCTITALPLRDEIQVPIDEQVVMEFYSR